MNILTGMALRASGGVIAGKQTVTTGATSCSSMPLVLPQERWHSDAPFVRASSKAIPLHPVDMARAIDCVNQALVTSPQMTAVKLGSIAAGLLVPGLGTVTAAAVGTAAHIGGARDRVKAVKDALESANLIFAVAGLRASILSTAQLHEVLGMPPPNAEELLACLDENSYPDEEKRDEPPAYEEVEGITKDWHEGNDNQDKNNEKSRPLPLGLDRLRPYADRVLPVDVYLGPAKYTHEGRTDGLSTLAAHGQNAMSSWNERRGARSKGGRKRTKLVDEAIWLVVAFAA
ncbi:hypothetical protein CcaverHIS002_0208560 [Cutaneotrichosporon cavernicola]|nr:hypothetical protein CcaverHIS002_0208560 [Cutaneotrichosporon cavernicola]